MKSRLKTGISAALATAVTLSCLSFCPAAVSSASTGAAGNSVTNRETLAGPLNNGRGVSIKDRSPIIADKAKIQTAFSLAPSLSSEVAALSDASAGTGKVSVPVSTDGYMVYSQTFNAALPSGSDWRLPFGKIDSAKGALVEDGRAMLDVTLDKEACMTASHSVASYAFDVGGSATDRNAFYFGLRLNADTSAPAADDGLWISLSNGKIGLKVNSYETTRYIAADIDMSSASSLNTVVVCDDMENGEITVYKKTGGDYEDLADISVVSDKITLAHGSNSVQSAPGHVISPSGYFAAYINGMGSGWMDNINAWIPQGGAASAVSPLNYRDVFSDTWAMTDELGRSAPAYQSADDAPKDKKVGMFYFLWHNNSNMTLYDHNALYLSGGMNAVMNLYNNGPIGAAEYWAEPYFGYYRSDDRWIIRKHAEMLSQAGVDFVFFDVSNGVMYDNIYYTVLSEWEEMRKEGFKTPQIVFFMGDNGGTGDSDLKDIWTNIYSKGLYQDLWFMVDGKPLLLGNVAAAQKDQAIKSAVSFFTVRRSWAYNGWTKDGKGKWPWLAEYPQIPGKSPSGSIEQLVVSAGFHASTSCGRSYADGYEHSDNTAGNGKSSDFEFHDPSTPLGLAYSEEWSRVGQVNPMYLMITGWNEWTAGKWQESGSEPFANTFTAAKGGKYPNIYVDNFNPEFSRDVEPMTGGFIDNYYAQTVENVWKFKGVRPLDAAFGQKTIDLNAGFTQWNGVGPEYRDNIGDTFSRDADSQIAGVHYANNSGRNDFTTAKVSQDSDNYYFYAETKDPIVSDSGSNWMNLYINSDDNFKTGWEGYDYIINRSRTGNTVSVEKNEGNKWDWTTAGSAKFTMAGNQIMIAVPKSLLSASAAFDFKWADNSVKDGDVMQFYDQGDTAPDGRFAYRYTTVSHPDPAMSAGLQSFMRANILCFRSNSYKAYAGGSKKMLDASNTNVTAEYKSGALYVPLSFVRANTALKTGSLPVSSINGVDYVSLVDLAGANGDKMTVGSDGIAVLSPAAPSSGLLEELSRIL